MLWGSSHCVEHLPVCASDWSPDQLERHAVAMKAGEVAVRRHPAMVLWQLFGTDAATAFWLGAL